MGKFNEYADKRNSVVIERRHYLEDVELENDHSIEFTAMSLGMPVDLKTEKAFGLELQFTKTDTKKSFDFDELEPLKNGVEYLLNKCLSEEPKTEIVSYLYRCNNGLEILCKIDSDPYFVFSSESGRVAILDRSQMKLFYARIREAIDYLNNQGASELL